MPGLATPVAADAQECRLSSEEAKGVLIVKSAKPTQPFVSSMPRRADGLAGMLEPDARRCGMSRTPGLSWASGHAPMPPTVGGEQWTENTEQLQQTDILLRPSTFHGLLVLCSKLPGDKWVGEKKRVL